MEKPSRTGWAYFIELTSDLRSHCLRGMVAVRDNRQGRRFRIGRKRRRLRQGKIAGVRVETESRDRVAEIVCRVNVASQGWINVDRDRLRIG